MIQMSVLNAWPLFVPQEVMGTTAVPSPTLVGEFDTDQKRFKQN